MKSCPGILGRCVDGDVVPGGVLLRPTRRAQVDDGVELDGAGLVTAVGGTPLDPNRLYV